MHRRRGLGWLGVSSWRVTQAEEVLVKAGCAAFARRAGGDPGGRFPKTVEMLCHAPGTSRSLSPPEEHARRSEPLGWFVSRSVARPSAWDLVCTGVLCVSPCGSSQTGEVAGIPGTGRRHRSLSTKSRDFICTVRTYPHAQACLGISSCGPWWHLLGGQGPTLPTCPGTHVSSPRKEPSHGLRSQVPADRTGSPRPPDGHVA